MSYVVAWKCFLVKIKISYGPKQFPKYLSSWNLFEDKSTLVFWLIDYPTILRQPFVKTSNILPPISTSIQQFYCQLIDSKLLSVDKGQNDFQSCEHVWEFLPLGAHHNNIINLNSQEAIPVSTNLTFASYLLAP